MTCQDYLEEVHCIADAQISTMFSKCLLRHVVCCVAARMLCSALPFTPIWQRGAANEERRIRHFCTTHMAAIADTATQYLAMLSLVRALLCAPDQYSTVAAYSEVRASRTIGETVGRCCSATCHVLPACAEPGVRASEPKSTSFRIAP